MNFIHELHWRGMIHDMMPGTEEQLQKEMTTAYVGIDPTADSLHIGHLVSVMMLKHLQDCGHKPIALLGGATGMIGDPSGRSEERVLLKEDVLRHNQEGIKKQLLKFLDFDTGRENCTEMVNNYDWMKEYSFLGFLREVGKHLTVNYMMAKDSVQKRLETGISFTEFSYQLVQAYDFYYLYQNKNCKLQMGGSDQWGNITAGMELIRRKCGGEAFALTCPLITKADGGKFGKSEEGTIWLDPRYTTPYRFYQFWLNVSDDDAEKYIKIFTRLPTEEIDHLVAQHRKAPHTRVLQKRLGQEVTTMVHSPEDYGTAVEAAQILFGKGTAESLKKLSEDDLMAIFAGVPQFDVSRAELDKGINILDLLAVRTAVFPSKGEARRMIKAGGVSINKERITNTEETVSSRVLLNNKYILVQRGKKNYFLLKVIPQG
ncbi:MAG: tyrosine--tRNA ligase [Candidatus Aminicenantes bacterium]|jgi:tyrosyl-tRNA synthetase